MTSLPYVVPFSAVIALLAVHPYLPLSPLAEQVVWILVMTAILALVARPALDLRLRNWSGSVLAGVAVFAIWIGPDRIFPGYHSHWLFTNSVMGAVVSSLPESSRGDLAVLTLRTLRAAVFVPIAEELFWRSWLMRWLISQDFTKVPLGAYSARAFWIVAVLFAVEHGALWDVGLAAGVLYNWWMLRTKSLGDLVLAHGVTNACLSAYVVFAGRWEYWP
ncbi:MAG: CAAX prenyl protease-related protein [Acidobacteriia bacterium]|nr:CAAX prenyl protease-related protein [Terriglobia bacterium]